jgi:two-component system chemotaxis response regulator CheY
MTGLDLLATLRLRGDGTPFFFVTSESSDEMRAQADAAGALGLVAKPFTVETLVDTLSPVVTL